MVNEGKGRLFKRKDGKYLIYLPVSLCQDSMFPFPLKAAADSVRMKISFKPGVKQLIVEPMDWKRIQWKPSKD